MVTLPVPLPALFRVNGRVVVVVPKLAVTLRALSMLTVQLLVPLQAPPQPANVLPDAGCVLNVTNVPATKLAEQVLPHSMPAGMLVTVPLPAPWRTTDKV